jgi:hypothetical protein
LTGRYRGGAEIDRKPKNREDRGNAKYGRAGKFGASGSHGTLTCVETQRFLQESLGRLKGERNSTFIPTCFQNQIV